MTKPRAWVINADYSYRAVGVRLILARYVTTTKPWQATANRKTRRFRTHAEAITWATKQTRKTPKKGKRK